MKKGLLYVAIFLAGGAVGALATYKAAEVYANRIIEEEIESIREAFGVKTHKDEESNDDEPDEEKEHLDFTHGDIKKYSRLARENYTSYDKMASEAVGELDELEDSLDEDGEPKDSDWVELPYIIPQDQYGERDDWDGWYTETLVYYADGYLAYLDDTECKDVEGTVGDKAIKALLESDTDSICVRNTVHKCDYEIVKDSRNYLDIIEDTTN